MIALRSKPKEMVFFKFHSYVEVLEMVTDAYDELRYEGEDRYLVDITEIMGYMTDAFMKEQVYQASIGEITNSWYSREECAEAMQSEEMYEKMRDTFNETFDYNGGFSFGLRYDGFERDFKKDIVRIMDEHQLVYMIRSELDSDGQVMLEIADTRFYHSPIQEVW